MSTFQVDESISEYVVTVVGCWFSFFTFIFYKCHFLPTPRPNAILLILGFLWCLLSRSCNAAWISAPLNWLVSSTSKSTRTNIYFNFWLHLSSTAIKPSIAFHFVSICWHLFYRHSLYAIFSFFLFLATIENICYVGLYRVKKIIRWIKYR